MLPRKQQIQILRALKHEHVTMADIALRFGVVGPTVQRLAHSEFGPRVLKRVLERCHSIRGERSGASRTKAAAPQAARKQHASTTKKSASLLPFVKVFVRDGKTVVRCRGEVLVEHC